MSDETHGENAPATPPKPIKEKRQAKPSRLPPRTGPDVLGPFPHGKKWRVVLISAGGADRWRLYKTREEAQRVVETYREKLGLSLDKYDYAPLEREPPGPIKNICVRLPPDQIKSLAFEIVNELEERRKARIALEAEWHVQERKDEEPSFLDLRGPDGHINLAKFREHSDMLFLRSSARR